jgi:release factor glutamine methyltransferase
MKYLGLKEKWQEALLTFCDKQEASSLLLILSEELLPHYNKLAFRDPDFELEAADLEILTPSIQRLIKQEPLQYILGKAWFYDLELVVNAHVLIPRPETEELVTWLIESQHKPNAKILDIGTGSGCIPLSLAKHLPQSSVSALDIDPEAVALAKENAELLNLSVDFQVIDILDKIQWESLEKFDCIVSNPPYIPFTEQAKMANNVRSFEPHLALFVSDENPLKFYDNIADFALLHLEINGMLFFECNEFNAESCMAMLKKKGFNHVEMKKDLQGKDRMIKCILT